jgi:hypothetical protein
MPALVTNIVHFPPPDDLTSGAEKEPFYWLTDLLRHAMLKFCARVESPVGDGWRRGQSGVALI